MESEKLSKMENGVKNGVRQIPFYFLVFFLDFHQILTHVHMHSHKPTIRMMPGHHSQNKHLEDVEFLQVS